MTNGGRTLLSADYKVPGGKLLRVRLLETGGRIESAKISGDFFLIPEDSLAKLEMMLEDVSAQGLGVAPDDFVKAILAAKPGESVA